VFDALLLLLLRRLRLLDWGMVCDTLYLQRGKKIARFFSVLDTKMSGAYSRRRRARSKLHSKKHRRRGGGRRNALFSKKNFNSKNGFLTSVWGPSMWFTLHLISLNFPVAPTNRQRREYKKFFDSLQHVLPCGICRENLGNNFQCTGYGKHVFKNRDTLSRFVHELHNCVNRMLGKEECRMNYADMRHTYENFRARCNLTDADGKKESHKKKKEGGCTDPITGVKSKCTLRIVPVDYCTSSLHIDKRCICKPA